MFHVAQDGHGTRPGAFTSRVWVCASVFLLLLVHELDRHEQVCMRLPAVGSAVVSADGHGMQRRRCALRRRAAVLQVYLCVRAVCICVRALSLSALS